VFLVYEFCIGEKWEYLIEFYFFGKTAKGQKFAPKKKAVTTGSPRGFFCSISWHQKFGKFSYKRIFFEFTLGIKNRKNPLWKFFVKKEIAGKKTGGPIIVHLGASSVQLFMNVTNRVLPHPVGGGFDQGCPVLGASGPLLPTFIICWNLPRKVCGFQLPLSFHVTSGQLLRPVLPRVNYVTRITRKKCSPVAQPTCCRLGFPFAVCFHPTFGF
jgi:hypothetical protein